MTPLAIYWTGFALYAVGVVFIGWHGYRKQTRSQQVGEAFWSAGRSLGPWSTGLSISAGFMSISWSCVYDVQLFYWYGLSALWLLAIPWLFVMFFYYALTPRFRRLSAFSQPEMLAQRFGSRVRVYFALPLAFVFLVWGGAEIYAAAQVLTPILHVPFHAILLVIAIIVAVYSYLGGFSAVVATDRLQFALVAFFVLGVSWIAGKAILSHDSLTSALRHLPPAPKHGASAFSLLAAGPGLIFMTLVAYLPGWAVETDIWLRLQAAKSDGAARKGVLIATVNSVLFIAILPMLIGLAALYLYPPDGGAIPPRLQDGAAIFAVLISDHAPVLLSVLLIVGLAAASMSTIDTCGNVVALSLSYDLLEPYLAHRKKEALTPVVSRVMSAGAIALAYFYAIFTDSLWDIFYLSSGILTTTIFIPMVALFSKRASTTRVQRAAMAGFLGTLLFYFLEKRGILVGVQPAWLSSTGLGYIVWGLVASALAYGVKERQTTAR
ncbi:MAG: sodium:solute symporter family protein [Calditrichaeota bacterium]|nr:MAG: sodium:solute symporter family protein [Calditrichota bacterium]